MPPSTEAACQQSAIPAAGVDAPRSGGVVATSVPTNLNKDSASERTATEPPSQIRQEASPMPAAASSQAITPDPSDAAGVAICRYFNTTTGCLKAGCRFSHVAASSGQASEPEPTPIASADPPSDEPAQRPAKSAKPCRWHLAGYCHRGQDCWFSHDRSVNATQGAGAATAATAATALGLSANAPSFVPTTSQPAFTAVNSYDYGESNAAASSSGSSSGNGGGGPAPACFSFAKSTKVTITADTIAAQVAEEPEVCGICMEVPTLYGLLENCDHVFCMACLREWRSAQRRNTELRDSGVTKQCPACRTQSHFVTPSSHPQRGERKKSVIEMYKERLSKLPCKHFEKSKQEERGVFCPFGDDCHYAHQLTPEDDRYLFNCGAAEMLNRPRPRRRRPREDLNSLESDLAHASRLLPDAVGDMLSTRLDSLRGGIQGVLGMLQRLRDGDEDDEDDDHFEGDSDYFDADDVWGLGGGSLRQFGFGSAREALDALADIDPQLSIGHGEHHDADDDEEHDYAADYFDRDEPEDEDDFDFETSEDVFGLRRAFEEGYARADIEDDDDDDDVGGGGMVHSFHRDGSRRAPWDHDDHSTSAGSTSEAADVSHRSDNPSSSGLGQQRTWRSTAPSPSSSFEERIWAIRDHQARMLGETEFEAAQQRWELSSSQSPRLRAQSTDHDDASDDTEHERDDFMSNLLEAARQSLGLDPDEDIPAEMERALRDSEAGNAETDGGSDAWFDRDGFAFGGDDDDDDDDEDRVVAHSGYAVAHDADDSYGYSARSASPIVARSGYAVVVEEDDQDGELQYAAPPDDEDERIVHSTGYAVVVDDADSDRYSDDDGDREVYTAGYAVEVDPSDEQVDDVAGSEEGGAEQDHEASYDYDYEHGAEADVGYDEADVGGGYDDGGYDDGGYDDGGYESYGDGDDGGGYDLYDDY